MIDRLWWLCVFLLGMVSTVGVVLLADVMRHFVGA